MRPPQEIMGGERQVSFDIAFMWNPKNGTNELMNLITKQKWVTDVENKCMVTNGREDKLEDWDWHIHSATYI